MMKFVKSRAPLIDFLGLGECLCMCLCGQFVCVWVCMCGLVFVIVMCVCMSV